MQVCLSILGFHLYDPVALGAQQAFLINPQLDML